MDKTAWFVVTLCIGLLGLQWYVTKDAREQEAAAAAAAAPTEQVAPAEATTAPTENAAAPAAPAPTAAKPQEIATLTAKDSSGKPVSCYHFQDIGGSISGVQMIGAAINSTKADMQADVLLNSNPVQGIGTLLFGLSEENAPTFDTAQYSVVEAQTNDTQVTLFAKVGELLIRKTYSLMPLQQGDMTIDGNAYALNLKVDVQNLAGATQEAKNWGIYAGASQQISKDEFSRYTYYVRLEDGDFEKDSVSAFNPWLGKKKSRIYEKDCDKLEWVGSMSQYYATIIKPEEAAGNNSYYAAPTHFALQGQEEEAEGVEMALGMPAFSLAAKTEVMAGGQKSFSYDIFAGPKLNIMLNDMTDEFRMIDRVMDYGILTPISYPMNWLINLFHRWFGNWGWAIVAMTFVVRGLIWPLYRKSYVSMKRMSLLQPKMKELKDKYPDDAQKVNMEMMKLYREYGISPMGGCLPMMLQIPIFFAFFYVLQTAAEFRGAEWIGWVTDLSQTDTIYTLTALGIDLPINVLPILMAVSMIVQMHMTPATGDPTQVRIMRWMPLMFFVFCYTYPSALALYWTTTNIISIIQTLIIRRVMPEPKLEKLKAAKKGGKKSFFERMMDAQQAALAEQQRRVKR
ncbi:MAG: membrane protein insertase YidC [Akkermansia sp.]|nr:membrane protein insertase YidC [Akkermansia sp.]